MPSPRESLRRAIDAGPEDGSADARGCTVRPGSIDGDYVFALSVSIAPTKPILSLAHVTTPAFNGGTGVTFTAQPLSAADHADPGRARRHRRDRFRSTPRAAFKRRFRAFK